MTQHAHVENVRILEVTNDLNRKDFFEATLKLVRYWKSWSQKMLTVMKFEIKIDSMKKGGGTQSWMVTSRGVDKNVMELAVDRTKPIYYDEASSSTEKFVAIKQRTDQLQASSSSSSVLPIKQRNWRDIPSVPRVDDDYCYKISKNDKTFTTQRS